MTIKITLNDLTLGEDYVRGERASLQFAAHYARVVRDEVERAYPDADVEIDWHYPRAGSNAPTVIDCDDAAAEGRLRMLIHDAWDRACGDSAEGADVASLPRWIREGIE